ncbi:MAG: DUF4491 family protein [Deltaproteobacteria bacterium]|nr:DUF4491 family protein [Deltaproteobacteria bacterium]
MNFTGIIIALVTFFAIGLGFVWVIKLEYYVGAHVARWVGALGLVLVAVSALVELFWVSSIVGVIGGTVVWGATELSDQEQRVRNGQFPKNPQKDMP